ncbi:hypothetical protein SCUP234_10241 [Seiridium cupressi]
MRRVPPEHEDWRRALLIQGMLLRAPIWYPLMPEPKIKTVVQAFEALKPYYGHFLRNTLSYALYDKEYVYKRPESATKGGALYWQEIDLQDTELEKKGNQSKETVGLMVATAPLWGSMMAQYAEATSGIPNFPKPTAAGQYVHRSGCVTSGQIMRGKV